MTRLLVIGLDGASYTLVQRWMADGHLPTLARLAEEGASGRLVSVIPNESPSAWATFMTGRNPGRHGLFGFFSPISGSYRMRPAHAGDIRGHTLQHLLSVYGRRVVLYMVPFTYPPTQINGAIICGEFSPGTEKGIATYPADLAKRVNGRRLLSDVHMFYEDPGRFLEDLHHVFDTQVELALEFVREQPWDVFVAVFNATDQIGHFFWRYMEDPDAPSAYRNAILDVYRKADAAIGELLRAAGDDVSLLVFSDHGMRGFKEYFALNVWLAKNGWLTLRRSALNAVQAGAYALLQIPGMMDLARVASRWLGKASAVAANAPLSANTMADIDFTATKAYGYGFGLIRLNVIGREPMGTVPADAYGAVRAELAAALREAKGHDGRPLVDRVYLREDIYGEDAVPWAPDIVVTSSRYWVHPQAGLGHYRLLYRDVVEPSRFISGVHDESGILFLRSSHVLPGQKLHHASLMDVAPTILFLAGAPIPSDVDGRILLDAFDPLYAMHVSPTYLAQTGEESHIASAYKWTPEEEEAITARLRSLGYI